MNATTVAVDSAKSVFEIGITGPDGQIHKRKRLSRAAFSKFLALQPPSRLLLEACGAAHHWGRLAESHGHVPVLIHPRDARPYVRRSKTDRADVNGLIEADRCADIHPVPVKSVLQQDIQALHVVRRQWLKTRTARCNLLRGLLREFGIVVRNGVAPLRRAVPDILADAENGLPWRVRKLAAEVLTEIGQLDQRIIEAERELDRFIAEMPLLKRLLRIAGVGPLTVTAAWAAIGDASRFRRGRQLAAWLGIPPREHSSGDRRRLGRMSKMGDTALRTLFIHGARSAVRAAVDQHKKGRPLSPLQQWAVACEQRCGRNRAAVAMANKTVRVFWAVWRHDRDFNPHFQPAPTAG